MCAVCPRTTRKMQLKTVLICCLIHIAVSERHHSKHGHHQAHHDHGSSESNEECSEETHATTGPTNAVQANHVPESTGQNPRAVTQSGTFKGSYMVTRKGRRFEAYRGIRYAEPPVGQLRFQPPVPIHNYQEEVDASEEGPACPTRAPEEYYKNFSEDCLRLNVYTPSNVASNASLPVVVFIHPGGFYSMSGRSDLAGPHYLLDRDLVLVTINYRLGSLGFLSTGDELAPGNNGMKDQVAALRWVRDNIGGFRGDSGLVTLAGCSAGSISVILHMISPMSAGLFHRGIALSGSPVSKAPTLAHERHLAVKQARLVGCPHDTSRQIIDCLRTKTWREIADSLWGFFEYSFDPVGVWLPVVEGQGPADGRFLPLEPASALRRRTFRAVPLILSQTRDEFYWKAFGILKNATLLNLFNSEWNSVAPTSFMLPRDRNSARASERLREAYLRGRLADDKASADGLGALYGDAIIGFPVHRLASMMSRFSTSKVFYSEFSYVGEHSHYEDPNTNKPIGAMHHDDLIYLFSLSYLFPMIAHAPGNPDSDLVDRLTGLWYNFARYGDPNPRGDVPELTSLSWPAMTPTDRKYMRIDKEWSVHSNLFEDRFKVWEELYPEF